MTGRIRSSEGERVCPNLTHMINIIPASDYIVHHTNTANLYISLLLMFNKYLDKVKNE